MNGESDDNVMQAADPWRPLGRPEMRRWIRRGAVVSGWAALPAVLVAGVVPPPWSAMLVAPFCLWILLIGLERLLDPWSVVSGGLLATPTVWEARLTGAGLLIVALSVAAVLLLAAFGVIPPGAP